MAEETDGCRTGFLVGTLSSFKIWNFLWSPSLTSLTTTSAFPSQHAFRVRKMDVHRLGRTYGRPGMVGRGQGHQCVNPGCFLSQQRKHNDEVKKGSRSRTSFPISSCPFERILQRAFTVVPFSGKLWRQDPLIQCLKKARALTAS